MHTYAKPSPTTSNPSNTNAHQLKALCKPMQKPHQLLHHQCSTNARDTEPAAITTESSLHLPSTSLAGAFRAEHVRLGKVFEECEANWKTEQKRMNDLLEPMPASVSSATSSVSQIADGKVKEVMKTMLEQDKRDTKRVQLLHKFAQTGSRVTTQAMSELSAEMALLKCILNEIGMAGGCGAEQYALSFGGSERAPRALQPRPIRIPDIGSWKL